MFNEVAKIIGDNLDSNASMVLFADKTITLTQVDDTMSFSGNIELQLFDTFEEAVQVRDEIHNYLDHCSKSRIIIFNPIIDASVLGFESDIRIPVLYAIVGASSEVVSVNNGNILQSQYIITVKESSVDPTKWAIILKAVTTVMGSLE